MRRGGRRSTRLAGYDYRQPGGYFITVCSHLRGPLFGSIADGQMVLSPLGDLVSSKLCAIQDHFRHVRLDQYVVMPDHLHAILILESSGTASNVPMGEGYGKPVPGSLSTVVRSFKGAVTRAWRLASSDATARVWQRGFFERVIRDSSELNEYRRYIAHNPLLWDSDSPVE